MDTSLIGLTANQLQNTADAAALAGAMKLSGTFGDVNTLAIATAAANFAANESVQLAPNLENIEQEISSSATGAEAKTFSPPS